MKDYKFYKDGDTWKQGRTANGDMDFVQDQEELAQRIPNALGLILGEWKFDTTKGLPFFGEILTKGFKNVAVNYLRKRLLEIAHVKQIQSLEITGIKDRRGTLSGSVTSDFDDTPINYEQQVS